jgi:hypothetical protein
MGLGADLEDMKEWTFLTPTGTRTPTTRSCIPKPVAIHCAPGDILPWGEANLSSADIKRASTIPMIYVPAALYSGTHFC